MSKEIEDALYEYPGVLEAAAIGVPDAEWGERVHAFVSFADGHASPAAEVQAFPAERLASCKRPKAIDIVPALPKNSVGKIAKSQLREPFWQETGRNVLSRDHPFSYWPVMAFSRASASAACVRLVTGG